MINNWKCSNSIIWITCTKWTTIWTKWTTM